MKVSLSFLLHCDSTLFQQVIADVASDRITLKVKMNVHVLAKSGRVVVSVGFGVAKRLQNGV